MKTIVKSLILIFLTTLITTEVRAQKNETRKFALLISSENGGPGRTRLKYSYDDALSLNSILTRLSGINSSDIFLLKNPAKKLLLEKLEEIQSIALQTSGKYKKTEFILYYSGHSDETGLLLENEILPYKEIREQVKKMAFDLKIVILDSCSSGAMTRAKGGKRRAPFIYNPAYDMRGEAYLTSSSSDEVSQESDKIKASFFTHYLVSGLYGAADYNRDLQITLSEAYQYAYTKTLERTEKSLSGPQHPNFDITMSGTGDVVMSNLRSSKSLLVFSKNLSGQLFIRDSNKQLLTEIEKLPGQSISLGLPEGTFDLTLIKSDKLLQARVVIAGDKHIYISENDFTVTSTDSQEIARYKGDNLPESELQPPEEDKNQIDSVPWLNRFSFQFIPEFNPLRPPTLISIFMLGGYLTDSEVISLAGIISIIANDMNGLQLSGIANFSGGNSKGLQSAGIVNINLHNTKGVQAAGILNFNGGNFTGLQLSGIGNFNRFSVDGSQVSGILNISGSIKGSQIAGIGNISNYVSGCQVGGIFNFAKSIKGLQLAGIVNYSKDFDGFKAGLINISETGNSPMIGLINIYLKESHNADMWVDETGFLKIAYRNSSRNFHYLYGAGTSITTLDKGSFLIGLGVHFPVRDNILIGVDYIANFIATNLYKFSSYNNLDYNNVHQLRLSFDFKLHKHLTLFGGIGLSYAWNLSSTGQTFEPEFVNSYQKDRFKLWPGFFLGARF